ncbi:MAG: cysteine desulfurase [Spirochaetales bacterium]|nr:cysteine desulfurase [Spirochaetales bacterium]
MAKIYLDWASTSPPLFSMQKELQQSAHLFGNPSSIHTYGSEAEKALSDARRLIGECTDASPEEVIFTSGATEANNMIAFSFLKKHLFSPAREERPQIIISGIEHASLWEPAETLSKTGFDVFVAAADSSGIIQPKAVISLCTPRTVAVFCMLVNNETGAIQPVKEIVSAVKQWAAQHSTTIHVHTDAVQAFGKLWFSFRDLGADSAALSAHKTGGPKGVGALLLKKKTAIDFLYCGGGQENKRRPGTENLNAICFFARTAKKRITNLEDNLRKARSMMDMVITQLSRIDEVVLVPASRKPSLQSLYSPYILSLAIVPVPSEVIVRSLDEHGIAVSAGSACNLKSRKKQRRVLLAMNIDSTTAESAIRISIGPETTVQELHSFTSTLQKIVPLHLHLAKRIRQPGKKSSSIRSK